MSTIHTLNTRLQKLNLVKLTRIFLIVAVVLTLVSSYLGYSRLYLDDERRFWMAIEQSMSTPSVTRTLSNGGTAEQVVQTQQFLFTPHAASRGSVAYDQQNAASSSFTTVKSESVAFLDGQYSRYTQFDTSEPGADGTPIDFSDLLGKWEGNVPPEDQREQVRTAYIGELVSLVVFGNFDADFRRDMIKQLQESGAYTVNFDDVRTPEANPGASDDDEQDVDNIKIYTVSVELEAFTRILVDSFARAGYGDFPLLNPAEYSGSPPATATVAVSQRTGSIVQVSYGTRQEQYTGYGLTPVIERPEADYEPGELQALVNEQLGQPQQ